MSTLEQALKRSNKLFVDGIFIKKLRSLVKIVTDSKNSHRVEDLVDYYTKGLSNILAELDVQTDIIDNPIKSGPPFLIGSRMESPELKTILIYGHGDTVPLQVEDWHLSLIHI